MDNICGSKFWDWNITWYSEHPDFTPCFKNTILVWIPCAFLWIFSPLQIYNQRKSETRDIPFNGLNIAKLVLITVAGALKVTDAIHKYAVRDLQPKIYSYSLILIVITYVLFFILTLGNLKMGIRWSGILFSFSWLSLICGIPNLCTAASKWDPTMSYNDDNIKQLSNILYYLTVTIIFFFNYTRKTHHNHIVFRLQNVVLPATIPRGG